MNVAYLLIGGNLGNRLQHLTKAKEAIALHCGNIIFTSAIYETEAWGLEKQDSFLNQALEIHTNKNALQLLQCLLQIETSLGRIREKKYGPRVIDIDMIFFNNEVIELNNLIIPHPQMQNRRFVLIPLNEIAADKIHPLFNKTVNQLLMECTDQLEVNKFQ